MHQFQNTYVHLTSYLEVNKRVKAVVVGNDFFVKTRKFKFTKFLQWENGINCGYLIVGI